jgi:hypothetical protein
MSIVDSFMSPIARVVARAIIAESRRARADDEARAAASARDAEARAAAEAERLRNEPRERIVQILGERPNGVSRNDLLEVLPGRSERKREALASLVLAGVVREFPHGPTRQRVCMLATA